MDKKNQSGFTLIELLVVIAIISLIITLAMVGIRKSRQRSRDVRRVTDIKQIRNGLELYYSDGETYPIDGTGGTLGTGNYVCLGSGGWDNDCSSHAQVYIGLVPADPKSSGEYIYTYNITDGSDYCIDFKLENSVYGLSGYCHADESGVGTGTCAAAS